MVTCSLGKQKVVADQQNYHDQVVMTEWLLLSLVYNETRRSLENLLHIRLWPEITKKAFHLHVSSSRSLILEKGCFPASMGSPRKGCIPAVCHHKKSAHQSHDIRRPVDGSRDSSVATKRVVSRSVSAGG